MTKTFDEQPKNYSTFSSYCEIEGLKVGKTINKLIREFMKENKLTVIEDERT